MPLAARSAQTGYVNTRKSAACMQPRVWVAVSTCAAFLCGAGVGLSARITAAAGPRPRACSVSPSLLELPDRAICESLLALAQDPWQGCPALRPVGDPTSPVSRSAEAAVGSAPVAWFNSTCSRRHDMSYILALKFFDSRIWRSSWEASLSGSQHLAWATILLQRTLASNRSQAGSRLLSGTTG